MNKWLKKGKKREKGNRQKKKERKSIIKEKKKIKIKFPQPWELIFLSMQFFTFVQG